MTAPGRKRSIQPRPTDGVRRDEVLPLQVLCRRLGWGSKTARHAQREGLETIEFGRAKFVLGSAVLAFFDKLQREQREGGRK